MDTTGKALALASLGGAAYLGYRYWYLPSQARQRAARAALAYQQRTGASWEDSMRAVGTTACIAYATAKAIPPQVAMALCPFAGAIVSETVKQAPRIVLGAGKGALKIAASPFVASRKEISGAVKDVKKFFDDLF